MISLTIELMLALLLVTCIFYCLRLEKRIRAFQSANAILGDSVAQLSRQTRDAEEALRRFRETATEMEEQLAEPIAAARALSGKLEQQIEEGEAVMDKISRIVGAATPAPHTHTHTPAPRRRSNDSGEGRSRSRFAGIG